MLARGGLVLGTVAALVLLAACGGGAHSPAASGGGSSSSSSLGASGPSGASPSGPVVTAMPPASPIAGWNRFTPPDNSFEVQMPGLATELKTQLQTATSSIPYTLEMVMDPGGMTGFLVAWADYPAGSAADLPVDAILAASQANDLAHIVGGTLVSQEQVTFVGHPGRTWVVTYPSGRTEAHAYLVRARVYLLKAVSAPNDDPAIVKAFFDSFRVAP
jgi:hypothetical protein